MSEQTKTDAQLWAEWEKQHPNPSGRSLAQRIAHRVRGGQPLPPDPTHHAELHGELNARLLTVGLPPIKWIPSPNYFPGRAGHNPNWTKTDPNTWIVCHTQVGWMAGTIAAFQSPARQASANYLVGLDGSIVYMVRVTDGPWTDGTNSGVGSNYDSITIEFEDGGNYNGPRTAALYEAGAQLIAAIAKGHNIPLIHRGAGGGVIGHRECSGASTACPDTLNYLGMIARAIVINNPKPPPPPPDTRPEWLRNLKNNAQHFVLTKPVTIYKMLSGTSSGSMVPVGAVDVVGETTVGTTAYWVTSYGATPTVGNGLLKTDVAEAVAPGPPPPAPVYSAMAPDNTPIFTDSDLNAVLIKANDYQLRNRGSVVTITKDGALFQTLPAIAPDPVPGPPVPPADALTWLQALIDWLKGLFGGSKPAP